MTATAASAPPSEAERLRALAAQLLSHDAWTRERLLAHQHERLRELLRHATAHSPYYRETLGVGATEPDVELAALPTLSKAAFVEHFDAIATDPQLRTAEIEAHLAGPHAAEPYLGRYSLFSTSGTSGLRGLMAYDAKDMALGIAVCLRTVMRQGVTPATRLVAIGSPDPLHLTRRVFSVFQAGREGVPALSVHTPVPEMVRALNAYRPDAIIGYPTIAALLADEQLEGRLDIAPRILAFGSEPVTDDIVHRVSAAWGVRPANVYAATEAPVVACSSPEDPCLDVCEDLVVLEVVDAAGRPVPPGTPGERVLVTNLASRMVPLIRYEIGDVVTPAAGPSPAGRPYRRLSAVDGRSADILRLPGRAGGDVAVHGFRLGRPLAAFPDVRRFQFRQDDRGLGLDVVLRPGAPAGVCAALEAALVRELESAGAVAPPVTVEVVAEIVRETGPGAKLKLFRARA
jgi:phenylacetate-coenzyme A ligase PaaK-like adenylate-forming protein